MESMAEAAANNEEIDQPALIPHIAEASSLKYPYEVLFRSLHKLHKDTATSEYLFLMSSLGRSPFSMIFLLVLLLLLMNISILSFQIGMMLLA